MTDPSVREIVDRQKVREEQHQQVSAYLRHQQQHWIQKHVDQQMSFFAPNESNSFDEGFQHCARDALTYLSSHSADSKNVSDLRLHLLNKFVKTDGFSIGLQGPQQLLAWPWSSFDEMTSGSSLIFHTTSSCIESVDALNLNQIDKIITAPISTDINSIEASRETDINVANIGKLAVPIDMAVPISVCNKFTVNTSHSLDDISELNQNALMLDRLAATNPKVDELLQELFILMDSEEDDDDNSACGFDDDVDDDDCDDDDNDDDTYLSSSYDDEGIDIKYNSMDTENIDEIKL